jgi:hypothetical protein
MTTRPPAWKTALDKCQCLFAQNGVGEGNVPAPRHNVTMTLLHRLLNVHTEMIQAVDFECVAYASQNKEHLHINRGSIRSDRSCHIVQEAQITCAHIPHIRIAINRPAVEALRIQAFFRAVEAMCVRL